MKYTISICAGLAGIALIASLSVKHSLSDQDSVIRIGVIVPLTGQYAALGESDQNAMLLAKKELRADTMELFFEDDAYDAKKAVTAYHKLKSIDDIDAVVIMSAPSIQSVAPLTNTDNIPLLGLGDTIVYEKDSVFQLMPASNLLFPVLGKLYGAKYDHIAVAHSDADLFAANAKGFLQGLSPNTHTNDFVVRPDDDYRTIVQKIIATKPQAVTTFIPKEDALKFLRALRVQDRTGSVHIVCDFGTELAVMEYAEAIGSDRLEGCVSTNLAATATSDFVRSYTAAYGSEPQITADYAYDAVGLIQALAAHGDRTSWIRELSAYGFSYDGRASGHIEFNEDGTRQDLPPDIHVYRNGRFVAE
ncbi:MAG TPA: ABC transporter substrate-binding protein [Candidatus Paceibacterota bacterium]